MTKILLTKYYPTAELESFSTDFTIDSFDFIRIQNFNPNQISTQTKPNISQHIVSSVRAAELVKELPILGDFYCVGETSALVLEQAGKTVARTANSAAELIGYFENQEGLSADFQFFCSNIRRDEIPVGLKKLGYYCHEVICYETLSQKVELETIYDGYVFFSPSGANSFLEQYPIPEKARIFAIGKTTAEEVKKAVDRPVFFPEEFTKESLLQLIKQTYAKK